MRQPLSVLQMDAVSYERDIIIKAAFLSNSFLFNSILYFLILPQFHVSGLEVEESRICSTLSLLSRVPLRSTSTRFEITI